MRRSPSAATTFRRRRRLATFSYNKFYMRVIAAAAKLERFYLKTYCS